MKKKQEGFTLLELLIAILLLSIFLAAVWQFFSIAYIRYHQNQVRIELDNNARNINQFIQTEIRKADAVQIKTEDGQVIDPILTKTDNKSITGELKEIKLKNGTQTYSLELVALAGGDETKGVYELQYVTNESGVTTRIPVSDMIQKFEVTRNKNSDEVSFYCELNRKNEEDAILKIKHTFTESLAYKQKYT